MNAITEVEAVQAVIDAIRAAVAEDWVEDEIIESETQFDRDLQLDSLEMVKIVQVLQQRYVGQVDLVEWFAARRFQDLMELDVGTLASALRAGDRPS